MSKRSVVLAMLLCLSATIGMSFGFIPFAAASPTTWTVDDDLVDFPAANFQNIQDAINAANAWDTILVYPGTYNERYSPPMWAGYSANDVWAPAVIVYKDGLTVKAVDPDPSKTVIQSRHAFWSNPWAIQISTNYNVNPADGTAPHAVVVLAKHVTIDGFRIIRAYEGTWATYNSAPVFIGDLLAGGSQFLNQVYNNTVKNCILGTKGYWFNTPPPSTYPAPNPYTPTYNGPVNSWTGVYIWKSSDNNVINNKVYDVAHRALNAYDGSTDAEITWGSPSKNNQFIGNEIYNAYGGIAVGAWGPATLVTDNSGTIISGNYIHDSTSVGLIFTYTSSSDISISENRIETCTTGIHCYYAVSMSSMTIEKNTIKKAKYWGINLGHASDSLISWNTVDECGIPNNLGAVHLEYCSNVKLECNKMINSYIGFQVVDSTGTNAQKNNIAGNTDKGAENTNLNPAYIVDARNSYWGTSSGPYHATLNPTGLGNSVSDNIMFDPWASSCTCGPPAVGGEWIPVDTIQMLAQLVGSAAVMSAIVASFVSIKRIKKRQN